jgi:phage terminase small subunit
MTDLTEKQAAFVREYLVDLNATAAYRRAGYASGDPNVHGPRLMANDRIAAAIQDAMQARSVATGVTAERVVTELARMAFFDVADIAKETITCPADIAKLPEDVRRAIVGWSWDKAGNFTLRLSPKTPSLDLLARHLGMLNDKLKLEGDGLAVALEAMRGRRRA